ncbi:hypothetical protein DVH24_005138 [Malus domestica]|uniref:UspA domain-containing protein n=1 Tax=Malus domestica TaxID=3750 RepID=A0A498IGG8_MALDO|nr:hypothetical protein DVH24_005138 [Malus domestica]
MLLQEEKGLGWRWKEGEESNGGRTFMVGFMLFQDPSSFVHQHLAPFVGNDTKSYVAFPDRERDGRHESGSGGGFLAGQQGALKWVVENVVRKCDHLILVVVRPEENYEQGEMQLWGFIGSPLIPVKKFSDPTIMKKYGMTPDAETINIANTATQKEVTVGNAREKILEAIDKTSLSFLVIGNRGLGKLKRVIMGNVSNHIVNNALCPVTVVKTSSESHAS